MGDAILRIGMGATMTPDPHEYCYVEVCGNSNQCAYHEAFNAGIDKTLAQIRAASSPRSLIPCLPPRPWGRMSAAR